MGFEVTETPDDAWALIEDDGTDAGVVLARGASDPLGLLEYAARRFMARTLSAADTLLIRQAVIEADVRERTGLQVQTVGGVFMDVIRPSCKGVTLNSAKDHDTRVMRRLMSDYRQTGSHWWGLQYSVQVVPSEAHHAGWVRELAAAAAWVEWSKTRAPHVVPVVPTPSVWALLRAMPDDATAPFDVDDEMAFGEAYSATLRYYRDKERSGQ